MIDPSREKTPVILVTGFLGAGKTSFLRELMPLLSDLTLPPYVILNDHANAEIDSASLRDVINSVKAIAGGCICCDSTKALLESLNNFDASAHSILFIEANGTTDPYPLLELLILGENIPKRFGPIVQINIVNEVRWQKRLMPWDRKLERTQSATASHLLCNRTHLASAAQHKRVLDDLATINASAVRCNAAEFALFIKQHLHDGTSACVTTPQKPDHIHGHHHAAFRMEMPEMTEASLRYWLEALPRDILRIKGFTKILGRSGGCFFQRTDDEKERPTLVFTEQSQAAPSCAVLIGFSGNQREILAKQCLDVAMKIQGTSSI